MTLCSMSIGLFLPAGIKVQVDENKPQQIALETCDLKGCYGTAPVPDEMLGAMKTGKRSVVSFQNVAKQNIAIPFGLANFAEAYQHVQ